jgi:hypothetical protein
VGSEWRRCKELISAPSGCPSMSEEVGSASSTVCSTRLFSTTATDYMTYKFTNYPKSTRMGVGLTYIKIVYDGISAFGWPTCIASYTRPAQVHKTPRDLPSFCMLVDSGFACVASTQTPIHTGPLMFDPVQ